MSEPASDRSPRERQIDMLILEYEQADEQGRPLNREEFLKEHAEFEVELREYFDDVGRVREAVEPFRAEPDETEPISGSAHRALKPGVNVRYFGDYEILDELGHGGMGVVYKARQTKLKKVVALKMIKVGQLASEEEVRRFQGEARAAARLDHPGIVAVHEVGVDHSQHYYAMDYVAGGSLSQLYREQPVPARRAAEIVKKLAEAMHYAHGRGIVHRDLKPANVLLTMNGAPRITDFGLAMRLRTGDDSTGVTITQTGQVLGTAGYMSPEQAVGNTDLVNTPTDIYSLGAVLYALLTSRAPFVGDSPSVTIFQVINKEPVALRALNPSVPRDLETICLKCLEKEPHKRYGTAQLLADDLNRFLEGWPVVARPISSPARVWRWCRRKPTLAGLWTTAALLALTFALGGPIVAAVVAGKNSQLTETNAKLEQAIANANRRRIEAEAAQKLANSKRIEAETATEKERLAKLETQKRLVQLERANTLISEVFENLDPQSEKKQGLPLRLILGERLIAAARNLEKDSISDDVNVARVQHTLAVTLGGLGYYTESAKVHVKALETNRKVLGPSHQDTLLSMACLGNSYCRSGHGEKGRDLLLQALAAMETSLPRDHPYRLSALNNLALVYSEQHRIEDAISLLEEAAEMWEKRSGPDSLDTLRTQSNLASSYAVQGELGKSLVLLEEIVPIMKRALAEDHPDLLAAQGNLARTYIELGRPDEAIELFKEILPKMDQKWGPTHAQSIHYLNNLASTYLLAGRYEEALGIYEETLRRMARSLNQNPSDRLTIMGGLAGALNAVGRTDEAIAYYEKTLDEIRRLPGPVHPHRLGLSGNLVRIYLKKGQDEAALQLVKEYVAVAHKVASNDGTLSEMLWVVCLDLVNHEQFAAAEPHLRDCLALLQKREPDDWTRFQVQFMLGMSLAGQKRFADAEPLLLEGFKGMRARVDKMPSPEKRLKELLQPLVALYRDWEMPAEAARWQALLDEALQSVKANGSAG